MSQTVKTAVISNIHDVFVVFFNHFITKATREAISKKDIDDIWKDLVLEFEQIELKTEVNVSRDAFGSHFVRFYTQILDSLKKKQIWWYVSLYKIDFDALPKNIKPPNCMYYLVLMTLNTKTAKMKKYKDQHKNLEAKRKMESEINDDVKNLLKQAEFEDGLSEGIIFPVNNTIIVDELRERNLSLEKKIDVLEEHNRELKESNKEKDKIIRELQKKINDTK